VSEPYEESVPYDLRTRLTVPVAPEQMPAVLRQAIAEAVLRDNVNTDVRAHFERSRRLFLHARFDYDFFTVAGEHALLTVEMALRERLKERLPARARWFDERGTLGRMAEEAIRLGLVTDEHEDHLSPIRELRNIVAHAKHTITITPPVAVDLIRGVAAIINHLWRAEQP
jgi:hypothetical protein